MTVHDCIADDLPDKVFAYEYGVEALREADKAVGDAGIVMVNVADPLCRSAALFDPADYTVLALTMPDLFNRLLEKHRGPVRRRL